MWRFLLLIPLFIGYFFLPYRTGSSYTNLWFFTNPYFPVDHFLIFPWANFDGVHYLAIAGNGYTNDGRFFPFFPLLISLFSHLFGGDKAFSGIQFFTALFLSNLFFILGLFVFYKLIRLDFSEKIARLSIFFLLVFPTSFYFVSIYSESLFLFLTLSSFYFARKKKWFLAGILGMFLSATRIVGIAIFVALLYEFFKTAQLGGVKKMFTRALPILLVPFGLISYMLFNLFRWGDPLYFLHAQGVLGNGRSVESLVFPVQTVFRYFKILGTVSPVQYEWRIALLEFFMFVLGVFLLYTAFRKKVCFSYILFSIISFLIPVLSGTLSGFPRYILGLFPIYIALAFIKNTKIKILFGSFFLVLLFLLLMLFSRGYFVA